MKTVTGVVFFKLYSVYPVPDFYQINYTVTGIILCWNLKQTWTMNKWAWKQNTFLLSLQYSTQRVYLVCMQNNLLRGKCKLISNIFIRKNTTVQCYKEIHLLERGLEVGNVVSMVVGVPSHLWRGNKDFKHVHGCLTLERKDLFVAECALTLSAVRLNQLMWHDDFYVLHQENTWLTTSLICISYLSNKREQLNKFNNSEQLQWNMTDRKTKINSTHLSNHFGWLYSCFLGLLTAT